MRKLESEIAALENKQRQLTAELEAEESYKQPGRPQALNRELSSVTATLERLNTQWASIAEAAAVLAAQEP